MRGPGGLLKDQTIRPANVYGAHPDVLVGGDAHEAKRRIGTLQPTPDGLWVSVGRTTSPPPQGYPFLDSAVEIACNLDKPGWWSLRFQHTVPSNVMGNETLCPHYGALEESSATALLKFWEDHKYG